MLLERGLIPPQEECTCGEEEWRCTYGGGCVGGGARCDGTPDCADGSDELGCRDTLEPGGRFFSSGF